jgi:hypothetical protein
MLHLSKRVVEGAVKQNFGQDKFAFTGLAYASLIVVAYSAATINSQSKETYLLPHATLCPQLSRDPRQYIERNTTMNSARQNEFTVSGVCIGS